MANLSATRLAYINALARQMGLDPRAVDAVGSMEGFSGRVGDGGHAFGPFQENNAGGVLTNRFPGASVSQLQNWAWSNAGIKDALSRIANVAGGLTGSQAINAIVGRFERPANPSAEIAGAYQHYGLNNAIGPLTSPPSSDGKGGLGPIRPPRNYVQDALSNILGGPGGGTQLAQEALASQLLGSQAQSLVSGGSPMQIVANNNLQDALSAQLGGALSFPASPQPAQVAQIPAAQSHNTKAGGFLSAAFPYKAGRLDQGHDFQTSPGAPIIAPGNGVVLDVKSDPHGFGPAYPVVHFNTGPYAGKNVYLGHTLSQVRPGQRFQAGQVLSHTGTQPVGNAQVPGWAEIGFANQGGLPGPDGQQVPF